MSELWTQTAVQNAVKGGKPSQAIAQSPLWQHSDHSPQTPRLACIYLPICVVTVLTITITTTGSIY